MSKSLGNVISPHDVVVNKSLGVDVLRWWVAKHASSSASVGVGDSILTACKQDMDRLRNCFRFLLGQISGLSSDYQPLAHDRLCLLDKLVLYSLHGYCCSVRQHYDNMEYAKVEEASAPNWDKWGKEHGHQPSPSREPAPVTEQHRAAANPQAESPDNPHMQDLVPNRNMDFIA